MFYQISERIADKFEELNVISAEDKELYRYGVQQGFFLLLNLFTMTMIGLFCGMIKECAIYMLTYMPLRAYVGGYHARTHIRCYVYSIVILIIILLALKLAPLGIQLYGIISLLGVVSILLLAPVEDENKPLDTKEQLVYRKRAIGMVFIISLAFVLAVAFKIETIYSSIAMSLFSSGILAILGKVKNDCLVSKS